MRLRRTHFYIVSSHIHRMITRLVVGVLPRHTWAFVEFHIVMCTSFLLREPVNGIGNQFRLICSQHMCCA